MVLKTLMPLLDRLPHFTQVGLLTLTQRVGNGYQHFNCRIIAYNCVLKVFHYAPQQSIHDQTDDCHVSHICYVAKRSENW